MDPARHEPGKMRHVDHEIGPDRVGDLPEPGEIPEAGIGGPARDDDLGLGGLRLALHLVHVDHVASRGSTP